MKALHSRLGMSGLDYNADKKLHSHRERMKKTHASIDMSVPYGFKDRNPAQLSPTRSRKKEKVFLEEQERITKDNLNLARRIFNIMEQPGAIHNVVSDTRHLDCHPGTMNFKARLLEAQRIHADNMDLAVRLDSVKPYYGKNDLVMIIPTKKNKKGDKKSKGNNGSKNGDYGGSLSARGHHNANKQNHLNQSKNGSLSARKSEPDNRESKSSGGHNILLEYTKIQDGRVLDVAVIKEPFRDRYAIFGVDVDNGQRYELRLTSEAVSSILDGDMLVTSVDNVEVWMALLNKVSLFQVQAFAQLPTKQDIEETEKNNSNNNIDNNSFEPSKPTAARPSSRPGGRNSSKANEETTSENSKRQIQFQSESPVAPLNVEPKIPPKPSSDSNSSRPTPFIVSSPKKDESVEEVEQVVADEEELPDFTKMTEEEKRQHDWGASKIQASFRGKVARKNIAGSDDKIDDEVKVVVETPIEDEIKQEVADEEELPDFTKMTEEEKKQHDWGAAKIQASVRGKAARKNIAGSDDKIDDEVKVVVDTPIEVVVDKGELPEILPVNV
jgi:hypothetical protein